MNGLHSTVINPVHKAHMGILVTLEEPTKGIRERAREYGTVRHGGDGQDPYTIQIVALPTCSKKGWEFSSLERT